ncbi:MAG TPA: hypothetical protein VGZ22_16635 [Isosphaeraceae bacterium]|nr:hypothetical protein [Isosphaeraceae bacterium]
MDADTADNSSVRPWFLRRPLDTRPPPGSYFLQPEMRFRTSFDPPTGFTGRSSVLPREEQQDAHFVPVEDRWRIGFPAWDRYGKGHPSDDDYPYDTGHWWDPFHQNVFKGDYPIIGQNTFLDVTGMANTFIEPRQLPTQTTPFESTARPFQENFFGRTGSLLALQFISLSFDLFHGDAAFKPIDWRIRITPTFNVNNLALNERGVVDPNVLAGVDRLRTWWALQEAFVETKFADLSPDYDFFSMRAGTQPFISDFRGFLFSDFNRGVRLFGSRDSSRDQFNLVYFRPWEKDTNSGLNSFNDRGQNLLFANFYRQDFIWPGYTMQLSLNYDNDPRSFKFDKNHFLVRPDPVGIFQPHEVDVGYFGWAGDGHIGRYNLTHQFYWAFGRDSLNPLANRPQTINAQMFAIEGSYDRDWARFRVSLFWSSGDQNINNSHATGFDTILDAPNFAGGPFSFWNRQQIPLFGVNLVQRLSLVPDLRSSKIQGQANFVNPGLFLINFGVDFDIAPKLKMFNNCNLLWFDQTNVLEQFLYQGHIANQIGADLSTGFEYKPLLSENISIISGVSMLIPGQGFRDIYNNFSNRVNPLVAAFINVNLAF